MVVQSAVLPRIPEKLLAVLAAVLGTKIVEMPTIHSLPIHGPKAFRLAKVCYASTKFCIMHRSGTVLLELTASSTRNSDHSFMTMTS